MSELLCRDCRSVHYCATHSFYSESHSLRCIPPDYHSISYTREMLFEVFSFRHFLSLCIQWKPDDANWKTYCRDEYRQRFDKLIASPKQDCLSVVIDLYGALDLFCKDECGVNFFHYGKRAVETESRNEFFRRADNLILGDWGNFGHKVWIALALAQTKRTMKSKEEEL